MSSGRGYAAGVTVPMLRYAVLRIALFLVVLLALHAVGMGGWLLLLVAAFVSVLLSYVLLARQREAVAVALAERTEARLAATPDEVAEDAEADRLEHDRRDPSDE